MYDPSGRYNLSAALRGIMNMKKCGSEKHQKSAATDAALFAVDLSFYLFSGISIERSLTAKHAQGWI